MNAPNASDAAARGALPAHVRARLHRDRRHRALRRRTAARRERWRLRKARRAVRCTNAVNRIIGSPSAITISAPGNTHVGKSDADDRRLGENATPRRTRPRRVRARAGSRRRPPSRMAGIARMRAAARRRRRLEHAHKSDAQSPDARTGSFSRHRITSSASSGGVSRPQVGDRLRALAHVRREELLRRHADERRPPGEHLVRHAAERVDDRRGDRCSGSAAACSGAM